MQRVIIAWLGVAAGFAALVVWLELGRDHTATLRAAAGVFCGMLVVGYPALYLCCKRQWWDCWRFLLLGAGLGVLGALPFAGGPFAFGFLLFIFALAGIGLGFLFWFAALWRNEGLTCPKFFCLPCGMAYRFARNALRRPG